jgi:acyl dehydratase
MSNRADHLTAMTSAWTQFTESVFRGAMAANTAALSAIDPKTETQAGADAETPGDGRRDQDVPSTARPGVDAVLYEDDDWVTKRSVARTDAIAVGDRVEFTKTIDDEDVRQFARASGDTNRLHLDEEFAGRTRFGGRITHGTLVSGLISAALARLPGLTIYLSQDLEFRGPVPVGDRVRANVEVVEDLGNQQYRLTTGITDGDGTCVVDGEAVVIVDESPEADPGPTPDPARDR